MPGKNCSHGVAREHIRSGKICKTSMVSVMNWSQSYFCSYSIGVSYVVKCIIVGAGAFTPPGGEEVNIP